MLGRLVRARRERLGLRQDELLAYGGPGTATVSKVERAAQENWAVRTQHQLENALGWRRGAVRDILAAPEQGWWGNEDLRLDFEVSLIDDALPDLSRNRLDGKSATELSDEELLTELAARVRNLKLRVQELEGGGDVS